MQRSTLVLALASVLGVLAAPAASAAAPTSASLLRSKLDNGGTFRTLAAIQRIGRGQARIVVMRLDSKASREVYDLVVAPGSFCSSDSWSGQASARLAVRNRRVIDVRRRIADRVLRAAPSVLIVERGAKAGRPDACARASFVPDGLIISPRDSASGLPTGVAAFRASGADRARVNGLFALPRDRDFILGTIARPCAESFTATDDLWQWRKGISSGLTDYRRVPWPIAGSFAIVDRALTTPAAPYACMDEEDFPFH